MTPEHSLQGIIEMAAAKEADAHEFYMEAAGNAENPGAKALLKELAEEELSHKDRLLALDVASQPGPGHEEVQGLGISEFLVEKPIQTNASFQDIMIYAMKREERAERFFTDLSAARPDGDLKQLFLVLRDEETKHRAQLERTYDDVVYKEN